MPPILKRILTLIPPSVPVGFVIYFAMIHYWNGDGILYQFIFKDNTDYFLWEPIRSFSDLLVSITNHYLYVNGRFVCHFLVMAVSSFMPQWMFAIICGAFLAVLLWAVCRLAGVGIDNFFGVLSVTLMGIVAFDNLTDPAFYINYVWMGTIVVLWVMMFLRRPVMSKWMLIPVGLFSLIAGQAHECFAVPVGFALIVYAIVNRKHLGPFELTAGICFCLSALTVVISPGLLIRMQNSVEIILKPVSRIDAVLMAVLPVVFIGIVIQYRKRLRQCFGFGNTSVAESGVTPKVQEDNRFWLWIIAGNLLLMAVTKFQFGTRAFTIGSAGIIVLTLRLSPRHRLSAVWMVFLLLVCCWIYTYRWSYTWAQKTKYEYIEQAYGVSHPDTLWVPDRIFKLQLRSNANLTEHIRRRLLREKGDSCAGKENDFLLLPLSLKNVPRDFDGNMALKIESNVYLLVQSRKNPAKFVVSKRFFPGLLDMRIMPDRELVFYPSTEDFDIYIDSTDSWIAGYYTVDYPLFYEADILLSIPDSCKN